MPGLVKRTARVKIEVMHAVGLKASAYMQIGLTQACA